MANARDLWMMKSTFLCSHQSAEEGEKFQMDFILSNKCLSQIYEQQKSNKITGNLGNMANLKSFSCEHLYIFFQCDDFAESLTFILLFLRKKR